MKRSPAPRGDAENSNKRPDEQASNFAHLGPPKSDKERVARERIDANKYDAEAWEIFASEAQTRPLAQAAAMYQLILSVFRSAGKIWNMYSEAYMAANDDDGTRYIFSQCLLTCLHIDLWKTYIKFIRRVNDQRGLEGREEIRNAYEFMTAHVGMDLNAGSVWQEYIAFLKAIPVSNTQEETHRVFLVRKAYQQAVTAPIHQVEQLWKEYENYESTINRALAKGLLAEVQPKFHAARAVYRERKKLWDQIDQNLLAVPPVGSLKEEQQCAAWKQLLVFEKGNAQRLEAPLLAKRVVFTFEQCVMSLYHYPDIWYEYAMWFSQSGLNDNAGSVFWRSLEALPHATVLYYAYAEFQEARGCIQEAKKIYETLVSNETIANSLASIQFMRFVRRTEGIEAARKVFVDRRKDPLCTYHFYVAAASLAFCLDKDAKKARDIFELGLQDFIQEPNYVLEYADFLCRLNDDRNVRALFERALSVLSPEQSVEVWNRFLAFEQTYGDISSMLKVAQRKKEALGGENGGEDLSVSGLQDLISRYRFSDLWPCSTHDLDHLAQQEVLLKKLAEKQAVSSGFKKRLEPPGSSNTTRTFVRPDVSTMTTYGDTQASALFTQGMPRNPQARKDGKLLSDDVLKVLPAALGGFVRQLPAVEGPFPDAELVLNIFLKKDVPNPNGVTASLASGGPNGATSVAPPKKRKEKEVEDEEMIPSQSNSAPRDIFRMRQLQRSRASAPVVKLQAQQQQQQQSTSGGGSMSTE